MTRYNRWMNEKLYGLCAGLSDAERKRDRKAFFGSIHGTLDHLLYGDLALLSRFTGEPAEMPLLGALLYDDFAELGAERVRVDARLVVWADGLTPGLTPGPTPGPTSKWLEHTIAFTSQTDGVTRELPAWTLVVHLFNHQTHHRGQLTTLLSQCGLDPGATDLHKLPGLARILEEPSP